jgi:hypothetical protein
MASDKKNLSELRCAPAPCTRASAAPAQRSAAAQAQPRSAAAQAQPRSAAAQAQPRSAAAQRSRAAHPRSAAAQRSRDPATLGKSANPAQVRRSQITRRSQASASRASLRSIYKIERSQSVSAKSAPSQQVSAKSDRPARGARPPPGGSGRGGLLRATPSPAASAAVGKIGREGVFRKNRLPRRLSEKPETDVRRRSNKRSGPKFFAVNFFENRVGCKSSQRGGDGGTQTGTCED